MTIQTKPTTSRSASSIGDLRVYALARQLEDQGIALAAALPETETYGLANDLRRSTAAIAHHIYEAHRRYSYTIKLESLHTAIAESEQAKKANDVNAYIASRRSRRRTIISTITRSFPYLATEPSASA